jgi:hypothetical protein
MRQQMNTPTTFLIAGGVGFLLGELTKRELPKAPSSAYKSHAVETSPLRTALSLVTSIQTLYTALPLAWMIKTFNQPATPASKQQNHPTMADSSSAESGTSTTS